jgi:nicotinamidase-related amidase
MDDLSVLPSGRTAVVIIDMINWMFGWRGATSLATNPAYQTRVDGTVIPNNRRIIDAARAAGAQIVYLRLAARQADYSDIVEGLRSLAREAGAFEGSAAASLVDELTIEPGDLDLVKTGSGGFTSCDLDRELRKRGVRTVIYTGVATNACVALTVMAGMDLGYEGFVVTDATDCKAPGVHEATLAAMADNYARKVDTDQVLRMIAAAPVPAPAR